jgi:hypothetical protein
MRLFGPSLAVAATVLSVAAAPAQAASDYVVTLSPAPDVTCDRTILDVATTYALAPTTVYTSALCGFGASLSKSQVRALALDPRVKSVELDRGFGVS